MRYHFFSAITADVSRQLISTSSRLPVRGHRTSLPLRAKEIDMRKITFVLIAICGVGLAFSGVAIAGPNFHAYVATTGNDNKPCTREEPCRTFQVAIGQVAPGGEVVALDSGEFGPVTIKKSVTLSGEGVHATITQEQAGANAITLQTKSSMTVMVRALTILGVGKAGQGITLNDPMSSSNDAKPF